MAITIALFLQASNLFSKSFPLAIFWQANTELALKSANAIVNNKKQYTSSEIISAYDFLADYNLEQGHYEANLKFAGLLFGLKHQTSFDSAFYYARVANYYHCYINPDSSYYFCKKAQNCYTNASRNYVEPNSRARYFSFLGNAFRNTSSRNLCYLDSALYYSTEKITLAINHRRYAVFLIDELTGFTIRKENLRNKKFNKIYTSCIDHLSKAEFLTNEIFSNKKSDLHSRIYNLWSLAARINHKVKQSLALNKMARAALVNGLKILNCFEFVTSLNLDAANRINLYREKKGSIQLVFEAEKLLQQSIPYWESFLQEELKYSQKNFDDRYALNPYAKLTTVYFELYKQTNNYQYLVKIQGLSELTKNSDIYSNKQKYLNPNYNQRIIQTLQNLCKINKYAIVNFIGATNPNNLFAIVSLPDTTLLIECAGNDFQKNLGYDYINTTMSLELNKLQESKLTLFEAYKLCFKNIDKVLEKKKIKTIHLISHGLIKGLNFDLLITDTISSNPFIKYSIINKYNFLYHSNATSFLSNNGQVAIYPVLYLIAPDYKNTSYPEIIFGKTLPNKIERFFSIASNQTNSSKVFFEQGHLIQFIGHIKSHEFSTQQHLILGDSLEINSDSIALHDLSGSSYLLNGCASNIGKNEMNNKINNLPNYLLNQHANAVISTLWPIDDKENAEFLEKFYAYLAEGMPASEALRQSKLFFAQNNYPPSMWGAYLYYGNDFYLLKKESSLLSNEGIFALLGLLSTLLIVLLFKWKRGPQQPSKTSY